MLALGLRKNFRLTADASSQVAIWQSYGVNHLMSHLAHSLPCRDTAMPAQRAGNPGSRAARQAQDGKSRHCIAAHE